MDVRTDDRVDITSVACVEVSEEFKNEQSYTDGDIFRNMRLCRKSGDRAREKKWRARLSESKRDDLEQLLRDERVRNVVDEMLQWPGLWSVKLGSLHHVLPMKYDQASMAGRSSRRAADSAAGDAAFFSSHSRHVVDNI